MAVWLKTLVSLPEDPELCVTLFLKEFDSLF